MMPFRSTLDNCSGRTLNWKSWRSVRITFASLPRLSFKDRKACVGPVTLTEVEVAHKDSAASKALGIDGLPYELYKSMPDLFEKLLGAVYSNWFQNGLIPNLFAVA